VCGLVLTALIAIGLAERCQREMTFRESARMPSASHRLVVADAARSHKYKDDSLQGNKH
jgi:hypothetical protein